MTKMYYAENPDSAHDIREFEGLLFWGSVHIFKLIQVFSLKKND